MNEGQKKLIKEFPVKKHALNKDKLGSLTFDESYKYFEELQKFFIELIDLDYENKLTSTEVTDVNNLGVQFVDHYLSRLKDYNIDQDNAKGIHDSIENEVINFYNDVSRRFRPALVYLRQQAGLESQSAQDLQKERKEIIKAKKEYERLISDLDSKFKGLIEREKEVETKHGEVAAKVLAHHFAKQSNDYAKEAKGEEIDYSKIKGRDRYFKRLWKKIRRDGGWLKKRSFFYLLLVIIISLNFIVYFTILILNKLEIIPLETGDIFTIEYAVIKIALITLLSWGLGFASKNYNIYSNLEAVARHRKNVAQTLDDFLATGPNEKDRSQMIRQGVEAMFKHLPTGYIPKSEQKSEGPIYRIINTILKSNKE